MRRFSYTLLILFCLFFVKDSLFAKTDKYRAMWREDPSTSIVIGWNQVSGTGMTVHYDIEDYGKNILAYQYTAFPSTSNQSKGMNNYFVRIRNLLPSTTYYFVIKDSEGCSERMSFRTAPDNPYERLSIIAGGDSRNYRKARQKANSLVAKLRPHCIMFGGDMTGGDNARQWNDWFDDWQRTISAEGHLTPIIVTRGNHEYSNKTLVDLFDIPNSNAYYTLNLGGNLLKIYTLNSLIPSGGNQKKWLEKDLQNSGDFIWRFAQYHFAIRPHTAKKAERNNQLRDWATLFEQYKVQLAVESDAHCVKWTYPIRPSRAPGSDEGFIRDDENGTVYIGEGCWGAPLRRNNDDKKWTRNSGSFNQFKWIFVDQDHIEIRTIKTDNADEVIAVDPADIFSPPSGLDIWNPSKGNVLIINHSLAPDFQDHLAVKGMPSDPMLLANFEAVQNEDGVVISWMTEGESDQNKIFEIQSSNDQNSWQTIAKVSSKGQGNHQYDFFKNESGENARELYYRLREHLASDHHRVYEAKPARFAANKTKRLNKLIPERSNGMIRAKYVLEESADIAIRLVDKQSKVIARSDYKNQNSGNYLQSIDMKHFPQGQYVLTIKANEEIIKRYLVVK